MLLLKVKDLEIESKEKREGGGRGGAHSCRGKTIQFLLSQDQYHISFPQKIKSVKSFFVVCGSLCMHSSQSLQTPLQLLNLLTS